MTIFSQRTLQRLLEQALYAGLPLSRATTMVRDINAATGKGHEAEWELVVFATLASACDLRYEPALGGSSRVDMLCVDRGARFPSVLVETTTVSDRGLDARNPVSELFAAIVQEASNQGLWPNYLSLDVRSSSRLEAASTGRVLALPGRGEIAAFIKRTVRPFLQEVSKRPSSAARLPVRDSDVQLDIGYDPMQRNAWLTYEGYQRPVEFRRSTLANALKRKARQIKRSGHDGPAGILLCDGGSSQIRDSSLVSQVVEDLFRNYSSVSFICLVEVMTPESSHIHITNEKRPRTVARLPSIKVHHNATAAHVMPEAFQERLKEAIKALPAARRTPVNAYPKVGRTPGPLAGSFHGGLRIRKDEVALSLRSVQSLMSGSLNHSEFLDAHGWGQTPNNKPALNFLAEILSSGHSFVNVRIEPDPDADDDWLVLTISTRPDPALVGLVLPG